MVVNSFYQKQNLSVGINSLQFRGSLLWNNLTVSLKNCQSLNELKLELRNLGNIHCTCLVCC